MLPRLRAEEQMAMYASFLAAGGMQMEDGGRRDYLESLETHAMGLEEQPIPAATPGSIAAMGIAVTHVPMPAEPEPTQEPPGRSERAPVRPGKDPRVPRSKPGSAPSAGPA